MKKPKPSHMSDEAWRQLTDVIPFRIQQVENGHHMSLAVMVSSIDKIACELGIQEDFRQACGMQFVDHTIMPIILPTQPAVKKLVDTDFIQ